MKWKNVAFLFLLVLVVGAFFITSKQPLAVDSSQPLNILDFVKSLFRTAVALCDPVGGGPGSGLY